MIEAPIAKSSLVSIHEKNASIYLGSVDNRSSSRTAASESPPLVSEIVPYYVASVHLLVQPAPLKRILADITDEEDSLSDLVVMDKVIVIPKLLAADE